MLGGGGGLAWTAIQGLAIGHRGWSAAWVERLVGSPGPSQTGFGAGAFLLCLACLVLLCHGLAARGFMKGDAFLTSTVGLVVGLVVVFVFWPVLTVLSSAVRDESGALAPAVFLGKLANRSIWGLDCLRGPLRCGVAWNTLFLAVLVGAGTTIIGLAFALIATRTRFPAKPLLRALSVLPIITPPFVIGLALILLFGRSGAVTALLSDWLGIPRTRWIYGLPGVLIAQLLAFAPIAFLVLIGVVQGISPSLEEAAQTLRASRWTTFRTVTWPLLRPGLANAFLLGFVESMADFGNPLVLVRQLRVAVDPDLLRRGGGGPRPGAGGGARPGAARLHAGSLLRAAAVARAGGVHHGDGEGRLRPPGAAPERPSAGAATPWRCRGPSWPS